MRLSNRTLIEITSAAAAVYLIADASAKNIKLLKLVKKQGDVLKYTVSKLDQNKVPFDEFDQIAFKTILAEN